MKALIGCIGILVLAAPAPLPPDVDVSEFVKQLKDDDPEVRRAAARALGEKGPGARAAVPALAAALKDKDLFVRRFSAQALGEIGPEAKSAIPALAGALNDGRKEVVAAAAGALGKMGPDGVTTLTDIAKDKKRDVALRRRSVEALGMLGKDAKASVPFLIETLNDRDLRTEAAVALGAMGPEAREAVATLQGLVKDKDKVFRNAVVEALKRIQGKKT